MDDLIQQVRAVNKASIYYVALFSALALPDICAALESADGQASKAKFIAWFDANVASRYGGTLDGETCYYFRCSMLHQGTTQHPKGRYSRIFFLEPAGGGFVMHNNVFNNALNIDISIFCEDICQSAETWWRSAANNPTVQANRGKFVTRYAAGLAPYVRGFPVIG